MPDPHHIDVTGRLDTWYVVFSPHALDQYLNSWVKSTTDEGCRHVLVARRAGALGVMQIEATAFGCFCEYVPVDVPQYLLDAKADGNQVFEWGIRWGADNMGRHIRSETLALDSRSNYHVDLEKLRSSVYIQPGYFSCVALVKVFLGINDDHVLKPRDLLDYLIANGAQEV